LPCAGFVDILVVMPAYNQGSKARRICSEVPAPFPMDLVVRTPENLRWRLAEGDLFHAEIVSEVPPLAALQVHEAGHVGRGDRLKTATPRHPSALLPPIGDMGARNTIRAHPNPTPVVVLSIPTPARP
jgi:hypothetical protein